MSRRNRSPNATAVIASAVARWHTARIRSSYSWLEQGQGGSTAQSGIPGSLGLRFYQRPPDRMHRHAVRRGVKGREERGYLESRLLPEKVQCPCAVFAAAPR